MSDYQDYESIMDKDEFASDAGYDIVRASKQHQIIGNVDALFTCKSTIYYIWIK